MRNINGIDAFRALIVFGVCLTYAYGLTGHQYVSQMLMPCVVALCGIGGVIFVCALISDVLRRLVRKLFIR